MEKLDSSREDNWAVVLQELIEGVAHHMSNRVAVLSGVADILARDESIPPILRALVDEVPKLEEGVRLLGLLVAEDGEEALEIGRVVADAVALVRLHPKVRGGVTVEVGGDLAPVVAERVVLLREIVEMIVRVRREVDEVVVRCVEGDGEVCVVAGTEVVRVKALG
jgi:hypothetical protein